jgi:hypothetical protein
MGGIILFVSLLLCDSTRPDVKIWCHSYAQNSSVLTIEVFLKRKLRSDSSVGRMEATVGRLLEQGGA